MSERTLLQHLADAHPGVRAPWFTGSGYLAVMTAAQLERLHAELMRQGEDCQRPSAANGVRSLRTVSLCPACDHVCNGTDCGCPETCWRRQRQFPPHRRAS